MLYPKLTPSRPVQGNIDDEKSYDAYMNEAPDREPLVCPDCGNVYAKKHWKLPDETSKDYDEDQEFLCPGCKKVRDGYYFGELRLKGGFIREHKSELTNLILNEVQRAQQNNPLAKLVDVDAEEGTVMVRTTTPKLTERLGRKIKDAYQGDLDIKQTDAITRATWERND